MYYRWKMQERINFLFFAYWAIWHTDVLWATNYTARNFFICQYLSFYEQLKFRALLSWAQKKFYNLATRFNPGRQEIVLTWSKNWWLGQKASRQRNNTIYQNCINFSTWLNKMATRAINRKKSWHYFHSHSIGPVKEKNCLKLWLYFYPSV